MSDYTFMKSGFDMLQNDNQTDDGEDFQKNLMSILI